MCVCARVCVCVCVCVCVDALTRISDNPLCFALDVIRSLHHVIRMKAFVL